MAGPAMIPFAMGGGGALYYEESTDPKPETEEQLRAGLALQAQEEGALFPIWSCLLVEAARLRVQKKDAVKEENFHAAAQLKGRIDDVAAQIKAAEADVTPESREDALQKLDKLKRKAVASEDYTAAAQLKRQHAAMQAADAGSIAWALDSVHATAVSLASSVSNAQAVIEELRATAPPGVEIKAPAPKATIATKAEIAGQAAPAGGIWAVKLEQKRLEKEEAEKRLRLVKEEAEKQMMSINMVQSLQQPAAPPAKKARKESPIPGLTVEKVLGMSKQDLWEHAWQVTWEKAEEQGRAEQEACMAEAKVLWKQWRAAKEALAAETAHEASAEAALPSAGANGRGAVSSTSTAWQNVKAKGEWEAVNAEMARRKDAEDAPRSGRDLVAGIKQRCPADQPLSFERLLASCPKGTQVRQLIQALAKEPQEFRQNWDGSEFCVRPANSRCVDWLPVQVHTIPPGFQPDESLPEEMVQVARAVFEDRVKPQGQASDDPLAQFLSAPGRLPHDTPLPFAKLLVAAPPGTDAMTLVQCMSRRRELFRQDSDGKLFCVRPRFNCRNWLAVNPYSNPLDEASGSGMAGPYAQAVGTGACSDEE